MLHYLCKDWRTDTANQRGGREWEPIKILLEGDGNSNKMNTASYTRLRLTTQVDQAHVATGVPLDLGINKQPSDPRTQRNTKPRVHWPRPVRPVSTTCQTSPCWWNLVTSTKWPHTDQVGATHRSDQSQPESPKSPNRPTDLQTDPNSKQPQHRTKANSPRSSPEQQPTNGCTGQTGVAWAARDEQHPGSTPPNPDFDLPNHSTDLNKTLGIIGTPHEESIVKFNPTKTCPKRRN
jgi:hypothetical protein